MASRKFKINPKDVGLAYPRGTWVKKKAKKKAKSPESLLQSFAEELCDKIGIWYVRIPDDIYRAIFANPSISIGVKKKVSTYIKSVPDMLLFKPWKNYNVSMLLEIKTEIGTTSKSQRDWGGSLVNKELAKGIDEVEKKILEFKKWNPGD